MTDRELMQQALSVLCNNVRPRDGVRDNKHLTPKSHAEIYQQTVDALRERLAQPEQEPVAYLCENAVGHKYFRWKKPSSTYKPIALYTTPPQRPWVGLTDEKVDALQDFAYADDVEFVKHIEAKLKEKNGG